MTQQKSLRVWCEVEMGENRTTTKRHRPRLLQPTITTRRIHSYGMIHLSETRRF